ncbi:unnamed protein product, partial [Rotaria sp. Silwood2]
RSKQRDIHNRLVYAYCDRIKQLSNEFKPMIKAKQQKVKSDQQQIYEGIFYFINTRKKIYKRGMYIYKYI